MRNLFLTFTILLFAKMSMGQVTHYGTVSGIVTSGTWVAVAFAGTKKSSTQAMIFNTGGASVILGKTVSGVTTSTGLLIPPSSAPLIVPIVVNKGDVLAVRALDAPTSASSVIGLSFFQ